MNDDIEFEFYIDLWIDDLKNKDTVTNDINVTNITEMKNHIRHYTSICPIIFWFLFFLFFSLFLFLIWSIGLFLFPLLPIKLFFMWLHMMQIYLEKFPFLIYLFPMMLNINIVLYFNLGKSFIYHNVQ